MIGPLEKRPAAVQIAGYLEKRGKMRMLVSRWKGWWFVLEGRLLLYYKSQIEYQNLSPCRGSLNMGLAASVQPGRGLELIVITRSQSVTLRASSRAEHELWLHSLLGAMALPNSVNTFDSRPVKHFRYPTQEYHENNKKKIKNFKCPPFATEHNETPIHSGSGDTSSSSSHASCINQSRSERSLLRRVLSDSRTLLQRPSKRNPVRSSVRLSKIAFSDTSIPVSTQTANISETQPNEKCQSMQELRHSMCDDEEENSIESKGMMLNGSRESKLSNSIKIELNLEDLTSENNKIVTEKKIGNIKITLDGCAIYGSRELENDKGVCRDSCIVKHISSRHYNSPVDNKRLHRSKEAKSDSNVSVIRKMRISSGSCENVQTLDRSIGSTYKDTSATREVLRKESKRGPHRKPTIKRINSFVSRFVEKKHDHKNENFERMGTIRKSLSFLMKVWKKPEKKPEEDSVSNVYESLPVVTQLPRPEMKKAEELLQSLGGHEICGPEPEPPPDYDTSLPEEHEIPPMLPPRLGQRPPSPWHDIPKNNKPVMVTEDEIEPPPLPLKKRQKVLITISQDCSTIEHKDVSLGSGIDSAHSEPTTCNGDKKVDNLDTLLAQLSDVNTLAVQQIDVSRSCNGDIQQKLADYDVPRRHFSLLASLCSQTTQLDSFTATHFLSTTPLVDLDSLDPVMSRLEEMSPDSLECDSSWSLTHATLPSHSSNSDSMLRHFLTNDDKVFQDSLSS